ncbi:MAG: hypothetical protein ACLT46_16115 [Hungatella sp.]
MKKGIITEYNEYCLFCGRPVEAKHHLIGGPNRNKAEEDGLKIPCCNNCHNIGDVLTRIHGNPMVEAMSKMMGQLAWEKHVAGGKQKRSQEAFRSRYGSPPVGDYMEDHKVRAEYREKAEKKRSGTDRHGKAPITDE